MYGLRSWEITIAKLNKIMVISLASFFRTKRKLSRKEIKDVECLLRSRLRECNDFIRVCSFLFMYVYLFFTDLS